MQYKFLFLNFFSCLAGIPHGEILYHSYELGLVLKVFTGEQSRYFFKDIALMRIEMFREFPYLYDGTIEEEREYLETYFSSKTARILLVFDGDKVVGFSNSIQMNEETDTFQEPLNANGYDVDTCLYIGEVMIRPQYQHTGITHQFFKYHVSRAHQLGCTTMSLVTGDRPDNHPWRPLNYQSLDPIWQHYGFTKSKHIQGKGKWKRVDTGTYEETIYNFWFKKLMKA